MEYCEVKVFIKMKENVKCDYMYSVINRYVNYTLLNDKKMKDIHKVNCFKFYTFCLPYPIEKDGVYYKDRIYTFNIRSINNEIVLRIGRALEKECANFKVEGKDFVSYKAENIDKLITLTPVVVTMSQGKYWAKEDGVDELVKKLNSNAERKLKTYFDISENESNANFISDIKQKNNRLIMIPYKEGCLFGNKFEITVNKDEWSQRRAGIAAAVGLGEKGQIGCGYCRIIKDNKKGE